MIVMIRAFLYKNDDSILLGSLLIPKFRKPKKQDIS